MKEELTTLMHSEFKVSPEVDVKLKAGCVWELLPFDADETEVKRMAETYGITYNQAMMWKSHWEKIGKSKRTR